MEKRWKIKKPLPKQPKGGWIYKEGGITLEGDDFESLCQQVRQYRLNTLQPTTDVKQCVTDQICSRDSAICYLTHESQNESGEHYDKLYKWLYELMNTKREYLTTHEHEKKKNILIQQENLDLDMPDRYNTIIYSLCRGNVPKGLGIDLKRNVDNRVMSWIKEH